MNVFDLVAKLKSYPPEMSVHIFGQGEITKIEAGSGDLIGSLVLISQSKALDSMTAIRELKSEVCRCGNEKKRGQSFCLNCYRSLPKGLQKALYNRVGDGYEQSYELACQTIDERSK